jgi:hypothetical protein
MRIGIDCFLAAYKEYGSTCLSSIIFWNALPIFWLSDAEAIKAVSTDQIHFQKDVDAVCFDFSPTSMSKQTEAGAV